MRRERITGRNPSDRRSAAILLCAANNRPKTLPLPGERFWCRKVDDVNHSAAFRRLMARTVRDCVTGGRTLLIVAEADRRGCSGVVAADQLRISHAGHSHAPVAAGARYRVREPLQFHAKPR
jgi:hypothetical protein